MDARNFVIIFLLMIIAMLLSFIFITLPLVQRESNSINQAASKNQEQKNEEQSAVTVSTTTIENTVTTLSQTTSTTSVAQTTITPTGNITTQEEASQQIENINKTVGGYDSILDDIEGALG